MADPDSTLPSGHAVRPAVPAARGPRVMAVLCCVGALAGLALLALIVFGSGAVGVADAVGLADRRSAVVDERTFNEKTFPSRSGCSSYRYQVAWDGGEGSFSVCADRPLADLQIGDRVEVLVVPWADEVAVAGKTAVGWEIATLVLGGWALLQGIFSARRYRRLTEAGSGPVVNGVVSRAEAAYCVITPSAAEVDSRRLVLISATARSGVALGDGVMAWPTRRSRIWSRPRGPWAVSARGEMSVHTHGWRRRQ